MSKLTGKGTEAYVDTSALIAFTDGSDTHHPLFFRLFADPPPLVTTSLVIAEGHGWFLKRYDETRALQFMAFIETINMLTIVGVGKQEIISATSFLRKFSDQKLTLTDAMGLHIMQETKITSCWSTDFHMGLTGVPLAIHQ